MDAPPRGTRRANGSISCNPVDTPLRKGKKRKLPENSQLGFLESPSLFTVGNEFRNNNSSHRRGRRIKFILEEQSLLSFPFSHAHHNETFTRNSPPFAFRQHQLRWCQTPRVPSRFANIVVFTMPSIAIRHQHTRKHPRVYTKPPDWFVSRRLRP